MWRHEKGKNEKGSRYERKVETLRSRNPLYT